MNILVTGARGFVGRNLCATLDAIRDGKDRTHPGLTVGEVFAYDLDTDPALLPDFCRRADFVFHLAGVNRPTDESEFMTGNRDFTDTLLGELEASGKRAPVMLASSIQAALDNPYGRSKAAGEELLADYGRRTSARILVYRFPNLFGKWCRPHYNSAVATFCHQIARDLPITVSDPARELNLVYIDDLVAELLRALAGKENRARDGFCYVDTVYTVSLGRITELLREFRRNRETLGISDLSDPFTAKLRATYLSNLPGDGFSYPLTMHADPRGSFTEIMRTPDRGQFSVNISEPGITKGNHWHHTKNEKFLVVSGEGLIRLRRVGDTEVAEYPVSGERLEVIDIPVGYTHSIANTGEDRLVTIMWASELFDPDRPDTYYEEV